MTPLAQFLLNDWCSPIIDRTVSDQFRVLPLLQSAKCFECSELSDFIHDLYSTSKERQDVFASGQVFAPAPVTFIELRPPSGGGKVGFLVTERPDSRLDVYLCRPNAITPVGVMETSETYSAVEHVFSALVEYEDPDTSCCLLQGVAFYLCLINTPNLLGRISRLPHAGLQRKLARANGMVGKFPLHAWTEITLCINPTGKKVRDENAVVEARLSGRHCLHFVRSFLRWRLNKLERVKSHWRGDSAIGIKRSRYRVTA